MATIIDRKHYIETFVPRLNEIKREFFGEKTGSAVVLHRRDIDERQGPFAIFEDRAIRHQFNLRMVEFYRHHEYKLIAVAIDKEAHRAKYGKKAWHPYHYCAKLIFERYCMFLNRLNASGDAAAESRDPKENSLLDAQWRALYLKGTEYIDSATVRNVSTSDRLHFRTKAHNVAGLQLSDMLLQSAFEEMLIHRGEKKMLKDRADLYVCKAIASKWDCCKKTGDVWGYGKCVLP
jgi:hypothetical protein